MVPVIALAIWDRLPKVWPFQAKPSSRIMIRSSRPFHSRTSSTPAFSATPCRGLWGAPVEGDPGAIVLLGAKQENLRRRTEGVEEKLASSSVIRARRSQPSLSAPVLARLVDTLIGAAIAHLFGYVWPHWEFFEAPRIESAFWDGSPPSPA